MFRGGAASRPPHDARALSAVETWRCVEHVDVVDHPAEPDGDLHGVGVGAARPGWTPSESAIDATSTISIAAI